jgi:trimeric autotransporter adhesin
MKTKKMTTSRLIKSISRSPSRLALLLIPLVFACFALSPVAQAVNPPPDGGYPGLNTAEGQNALLSLNTSTGLGNTAVGWFSLKSDVNGSFNTAIGAGTLLFNLGDPNTGDGTENTAVGATALLFNTVGTQNTAVGAFALFSNTEGPFNTATGWHALYSNTTGDRNTAFGSRAMLANTTGSSNTAIGRTALFVNTEGANNVAVGIDAVQDNTIGNNNTGIGSFALLANTTGNNNTATGYAALGGNAPDVGTGDNNTATGANALSNNTTGTKNTANGFFALGLNTTGNWNTASGEGALGFNQTGNENTAYGQVALQNVTGSKNIGLGNGAGCKLTTGSNNIAIAHPGVAGDSNTIRIGAVGTETSCANFQLPAHTATYIAGISGTGVVGDAVVVDANGQLGTATSSARFKKEIKPMDKTSEAILALKPVSFQYKSDTKGTPRFGLIAEEVAKVNPDLVVRDRKGEIYSVRYEAVNAMLLNEFLKEHRAVQELKSTVAKQEAIIAKQQKGFESKIAAQQKQIEALSDGLQKVSAQVEMNRTARQTVLNSR